MKYIQLEDNTKWPDSNNTDLEWRMRYGEDITKEELLSAASIISAYQHLLYCSSFMPDKLRKIRKQIKNNAGKSCSIKPNECSIEMLQEAMNEGVRNGLFSKYDSMEKVAEKWENMKKCIEEALNKDI